MDCSPPGSSVHGIFQAKVLEWVATASSRGCSQPRDWTWVSSVPYTAGRFLTAEPLGKSTSQQSPFQNPQDHLIWKGLCKAPQYLSFPRCEQGHTRSFLKWRLFAPLQGMRREPYSNLWVPRQGPEDGSRIMFITQSRPWLPGPSPCFHMGQARNCSSR